MDCLAMRDRTWGFRSEYWKGEGNYGGYTNGAAATGESFLAVATHESARSGYVCLDGHRVDIARGYRRVQRDPDHGFVTEVVVVLTDREGRELEAVGRSLSRMAMPLPGVHAVVWTSLMSWTINGVEAWGEDQEPWPTMAWSRALRNGTLP